MKRRKPILISQSLRLIIFFVKTMLLDEQAFYSGLNVVVLVID